MLVGRNTLSHEIKLEDFDLEPFQSRWLTPSSSLSTNAKHNMYLINLTRMEFQDLTVR